MAFNQLSDAQAERLAILAEEAAEVIQIVGKILRHGYDSYNPYDQHGITNRQLLEREVGDFLAVRRIMLENGDMVGHRIAEAQGQKLLRIGRYMHHQGEGENKTLLVVENAEEAYKMRQLVKRNVEVIAPFESPTGDRFDSIVVSFSPRSMSPAPTATEVGYLRDKLQDYATSLKVGGVISAPGWGLVDIRIEDPNNGVPNQAGQQGAKDPSTAG